MVSLYVEMHDFGWDNYTNRYNEIDIYKAPRPRIALISTPEKWYSIDRTGLDAVVFWTTESLSWPRQDNKPIRAIFKNDFVFSSSSGPDNNLDLLYWIKSTAHIYKNTKFKKFLPNLNITQHKLFCALGNGRLPRCYIYCKLKEKNLIENNLVSFVSPIAYKHVESDRYNELIGQEEMSNYVRSNLELLPQTPISIRFEDDWNITKLHKDCCRHLRVKNFMIASIFPTKVINKSSLLLVPETTMNENEFFISEKTMKALISGRPSLILAGRNYLDYLKDLGFMTWNTVLDESYHQLAGQKNRIDAALIEVENFLSRDILNEHDTLKKIKEIAVYNRNHLFNNNWNYNQLKAISLVMNKVNK